MVVEKAIPAATEITSNNLQVMTAVAVADMSMDFIRRHVMVMMALSLLRRDAIPVWAIWHAMRPQTRRLAIIAVLALALVVMQKTPTFRKILAILLKIY